jgi:hypothetical protein
MVAQVVVGEPEAVPDIAPRAPAGGSPSHSTSASVSTLTTRPASSSSAASSTRCRGADTTTTGRSPSLTVNGPSSPKSTTSTLSGTVPAAVPADSGHTPNTSRSLPGAVSHR